MQMVEYETTVVIRPDVGGEAIESTLDKVRDAVSSKGGHVLAINHWGRKKLAYEIQKQTRGIYVHTHYLGRADLVAEVERNLRISDNVLRFLTVKMDDGVTLADRTVQEYVAPEYDAALAASTDDEAGEDGVEAASEGKAPDAAAEAPQADEPPQAEETKPEAGADAE